MQTYRNQAVEHVYERAKELVLLAETEGYGALGYILRMACLEAEKISPHTTIEKACNLKKTQDPDRLR